MWSSSGRRVLQELLSLRAVRGFRGTAAQNTVVVERWWQVPLSKVGRPPRLNPRRHRIYRLVEDRKNLPQEKLELILTQTVPKLGGRGDTVFVKKSLGRNKLLAEGLAVYASPENKQMFAEEIRLLLEGRPEERSQTRTGQLTVEFLQRSKLSFVRMPCEEYRITKEVVMRQLTRKLGVVASPHAVNFPFESAKDVGEYWCEITVNGLDTVRLPISVLPYEDMSAKHQRELKAQRKQEAMAAAAAGEAEADEVAPDAAAVATASEAVADVSAAAEVLPNVSAGADETAQDASAAPEAATTTSEVVAEASPAAMAATETIAEVSAPDVAAEGKDEGVLKVDSDAAAQAEAVKEEAGKPADEESAASTRETTAPASESPEKK